MAITAGQIVFMQGNASDCWDMKILTPEQGDLFYFDGTNWNVLAHGTSGQYLKTGGHAANPSWDSPAGGGDVVGPAGATADQLVLFDGATGKLIKASTGTGIVRVDSGVVSVDTDITDLVSAASDTVAGKIELAIASEVTTGTATDRAITPDALAGSTIFGRKAIQVTCVAYTTNVAIADGVGYFVVPESMNGMNVVRVHAQNITAGATSGTTDIMLYNVTDSQDILSTAVTITYGELSAADGTINTSYDDLATGDLIRVDVDAIAGTAPKGLIVTVEGALP